MINSLILYKNTIIYKEFAQRYIAVSESSVLGALRPLALHSRPYAGALREACALPSKRKILLQRKKKGGLRREKRAKSLGIV